MASTLPIARETFIAAIKRDTPGTDLPRLVKVLDALVAWSVARPDLLAFRPSVKRDDVVSFECVATKAVFWSAQATRGAAPKLEIYPAPSRSLTAEDRVMVMETLNAHSREALIDGDRLRIGFGALKNDTARAAILAMMKQLLANVAQPAVAAS